MRTLAEDVATATWSRLVALECHAPIEVAVARAQRRSRPVLMHPRQVPTLPDNSPRSVRRGQAHSLIETDVGTDQALGHALATLTPSLDNAGTEVCVSPQQYGRRVRRPSAIRPCRAALRR